MRRLWLISALLIYSAPVFAYIEAGYTLAEVAKVDVEKNLILYKKLRDLKGQMPDGPIKHNIGQRGFNPREPKNIMDWAHAGRKAIIFANNEACETCIDFYWYQCAKEGEWWTLNHAEPYLLRTYCGTIEQLLPAVGNMLAGREVNITAMRDGLKEKLHLREGQLIRLRASLTLLDFDQKRDFVSVVAYISPPAAPATRPARAGGPPHKESPGEQLPPVPPLPDRPIPASIGIDKAKRTVTVPCIVAPRKLDYLSQIYPIEVVATWPHPQGRKAHETVINLKDVKPSDVHIALQRLGLHAGHPIHADAKPDGPLLRLYLSWPEAPTPDRRVLMEKCLIDPSTTMRIPPVNWRFTGSITRQPDPEKDEKVYGADLTGTFISLFPVTDEAVIQTDLTPHDLSQMKLQTNPDLLPKEGTPLTLIIEAR
jgi:hypothetical protein